MRATGRGYNHFLSPFLKSLPKVDEKRTFELAQQLTLESDNLEVRDSLFKIHIKLAFQIAAHYEHFDKEELFSAAIMGVFKALERWPEAVEEFEGEQTYNITSYICGWVRSQIREAICKSAKIPVPRTTLIEGKHKVPKTSSFGSEDEAPHTYDNHQQLLEINELIDRLSSDPRDRKILRLRMEDKSDREIAEILGFSSVTISNCRKRLGVRLKELIHE